VVDPTVGRGLDASEMYALSAAVFARTVDAG
jgi:hypothetical protein